MSDQKLPFEQARENIRLFTENAEMLYNLKMLSDLMKDVSSLSEEEKKGIHAVLDIAITNLSEHIKKKGGKWN
jgi:hypothetical protein